MIKVLVVEDDISTSDVLQELCGCWNVECRTAKDLTDAKNICREWRPDLVYIDVMLGKECGLDLIEWLRTECVPPPRILVTTASNRLREKAESYHPEYFLTKPFDINILESIVLNKTS